MISGERIFIDTWAWLALGHRRDSFHDKVEKVFRQIQSENMPVVSSEYILDELITLLFRRENYTESVRFTDRRQGRAAGA
jgi:uncharacterized protein